MTASLGDWSRRKF